MTDPVPFLRWPGGKRWLVPEVRLRLNGFVPRRYFEPFLGGGAMFFGLSPDEALLSDINADLINAYKQVKGSPGKLETELRKLKVSRATYNLVRSQDPTSAREQAVRFLYLNRTAFAGIYRLNQEGKFNVPYGGGQRRPDVLWKKKLLTRASAALRNASLVAQDFESIIGQARKNDLVYCDPTYTVTHNDNGFVRYNESNFSWADQERLAKVAAAAARRGAIVVVSNAHHRRIRALYPDFRARTVWRFSGLSTDRTYRGQVCEYLLTSGTD